MTLSYILPRTFPVNPFKTLFPIFDKEAAMYKKFKIHIPGNLARYLCSNNKTANKSGLSFLRRCYVEVI